MTAFLSTPSARRATTGITTTKTSKSYFYPRPPRGGRPAELANRYLELAKFLSTPSARRATIPDAIESEIYGISIHALREEGDYLDLPFSA